MLNRLLDLVFIRITINMQNLSRIDQISIFDLGPVSLEEQRPLVGVTVNFLLGRDTPEVITSLNDIPGDQSRLVVTVRRGTSVGRCGRGTATGFLRCCCGR